MVNTALKIDLKFNSKLIKSPGLIHYWPFNSHIRDIIGGAHLFNGFKAGLTSDRFGRPLSALILNGGYYQLPPGNYFQASFTVSAWIYRRTDSFWNRLFDFSNGPNIDYIYVSTSTSIVGETALCSTTQCFVANMTLSSYVWNHLTLTVDINKLESKFYINGTFLNSNQFSGSFNLHRKFNYLGRDTNMATLSDSKIDEFKIFNRALSQQEILNEINNDAY